MVKLVQGAVHFTVELALLANATKRSDEMVLSHATGMLGLGIPNAKLLLCGQWDFKCLCICAFVYLCIWAFVHLSI